MTLFASLRCGMSFNFIRRQFFFILWILFVFSRCFCTAYRIFGSAFFCAVGSRGLSRISSWLAFLFYLLKLDWVLSVLVRYRCANRRVRVVNYSRGRSFVLRKFVRTYMLFYVIMFFLTSGCRLLPIQVNRILVWISSIVEGCCKLCRQLRIKSTFIRIFFDLSWWLKLICFVCNSRAKLLLNLPLNGNEVFTSFDFAWITFIMSFQCHHFSELSLEKLFIRILFFISCSAWHCVLELWIVFRRD